MRLLPAHAPAAATGYLEASTNVPNDAQRRDRYRTFAAFLSLYNASRSLPGRQMNTRSAAPLDRALELDAQQWPRVSEPRPQPGDRDSRRRSGVYVSRETTNLPMQ
jgi:hypothetical protein